jgi:NitT/TauT family transport system substrate-binding protein
MSISNALTPRALTERPRTPGALPRRSVLRAGLLGLGGAAALAACGSGGHSAVRLEDPGAGTAGAVVRPISEQHGLLGSLEVTYVADGGPGDTQNKLISGALDSASMGPLGGTIANQAGADLVLYSTSLNNHVRWLVAPNSPYRTPADLRGKKVATPANNSDAFRSTQLACAVNGIDLTREFQLFPGAVLAQLALFNRGDVDAIVTIEPNATRLVAQGARQIATVGDMWHQGTGEDPNGLFLNGQATTRSWLHANQATMATLASTRLKVHQLIRDRPQVLAELHQAYGIPATEKQAIALLPSRLPAIYPVEWSAGTFANMTHQLRVAQQVGLIKAPPAQPLWVDLGAAA